jgi:hypothetical protein
MSQLSPPANGEVPLRIQKAPSGSNGLISAVMSHVFSMFLFLGEPHYLLAGFGKVEVHGGENEATSRFEAESPQFSQITWMKGISFLVEFDWAADETGLPGYGKEE